MGKVIAPPVFSPFGSRVGTSRTVQASSSPLKPSVFASPIQSRQVDSNRSASARTLAPPPAYTPQGGQNPGLPAVLSKSPIQRAEDPDWHSLRKGGGSFGAKLVYVANESDEYTTKLANLFADEAHQRKPRSYAGDRRRQVLRWLATYLLNKFGGVEIQCYEDTDGVIYVSSNLNSVNNAMILAQNRGALFPAFAAPTLPMSKERVARHVWKTGRLAPAKNDDEVRLKNRITQFGVVVIPEDKDVVAGYHAERRIRKHLGKVLDSARLAGTRRACMTCATTLDLPKEAYPGILYTTSAGLGGVSIEEVQNVAEQRELRSHITKNRVGSLTDGYGTDSEDDAY